MQQRTVEMETANITIVLENIQIGPRDNDSDTWMLSKGQLPFEKTLELGQAFFANKELTWNEMGLGNTSCASGGSGRMSKGYIDPYSPLQIQDIDASVTVKLSNMTLVHFTHINVHENRMPWNISGSAGDSRIYQGGDLEISSNGHRVFTATDLKWIQNISYPEPAGPGSPGIFDVSAYLVGNVDMFQSSQTWLDNIDPAGLGVVVGVVSGASFGDSSLCYASNTYWITLRGLSKASNAKGNAVGRPGTDQGTYGGSPHGFVDSARTLAAVAKTSVFAVSAAALGSSVIGFGAALVSQGVPPPSGSCLARLLMTAAFVAKTSLIQGFHTDATIEFGSGLEIFLARVRFPLKRTYTARVLEAPLELPAVDRSAAPAPISETVFLSSFTLSLSIVGVILVLVLLVWILTRRMPLERRAKNNGWTLYAVSASMAFLFGGAVFNSLQYLRSSMAYKTGKPILYFCAAVQFMLIGIGFPMFLFTIVILASRFIQRRDLLWVPKLEFAAPDVRRDPLIGGKYSPSEENVGFHGIYNVIYGSFAGPQIWFATAEVCVGLLDAMISALLWNQIVCFGLLVALYAIYFSVHILMGYFVDKVEGAIVRMIIFVQLVYVMLEFAASIGDNVNAETFQFAAIVIGFACLVLSVTVCLYADVIPALVAFYKFTRRHYQRWKLQKNLMDPDQQLAKDEELARLQESDWSGFLSESEEEERISDSEDPRDRFSGNESDPSSFGNRATAVETEANNHGMDDDPAKEEKPT
jgi:hypothetical protein